MGCHLMILISLFIFFGLFPLAYFTSNRAPSRILFLSREKILNLLPVTIKLGLLFIFLFFKRRENERIANEPVSNIALACYFPIFFPLESDGIRQPRVYTSEFQKERYILHQSKAGQSKIRKGEPDDTSTPSDQYQKAIIP